MPWSNVGPLPSSDMRGESKTTVPTPPCGQKNHHKLTSSCKPIFKRQNHPQGKDQETDLFRPSKPEKKKKPDKDDH